jgi:hypothetical protein
MKFYVAFDGESFQEAIESHRSGGYSSEEDAVNDTLTVEKEGTEFFVITDKLSTLSRYIIKSDNGNLIAERITTAVVGSAMRRDASNMTHREILFELVTALRNQNGATSIAVKMKLRLAEESLGLK